MQIQQQLLNALLGGGADLVSAARSAWDDPGQVASAIGQRDRDAAESVLARTQAYRDEMPEFATPAIDQITQAIVEKLPDSVTGTLEDPNLQVGMQFLTPLLGPLGYRAGKAFKHTRQIDPSLRANRVAAGEIGRQKGEINLLGGEGIEPVTMQRVSTRIPSPAQQKKQGIDAHATDDLIVDALLMPEAKLEKGIGMLRGDTGDTGLWTPYRNLSADPKEALEQVNEIQGSNLKRIMSEMDPKWAERSEQWYEGFNRLAQNAATRHGVSNEQATGIIAALSPQTEWNMNLTRADRIMDTWTNHQNTPWSQEMDQQLKAVHDSVNDKLKPDVKAIQGKRLSELDTAQQKALWIRTYDQAHNPRWFWEYEPEGGRAGVAKRKDGEPRQANWASTNTITAAVNMLEDGSIDNISRNLGGQHKVRSFYRNAADPDDPDTTTMDTHAIAAAMLQPHGASAVPVSQNFGAGLSDASTGMGGTYPIHQSSYQSVARELGMPSRQVQSPTWEGVRQLFDGKKGPAYKKKANQIWSLYNEGEITLPQAQQAIIDAFGGIETPGWVNR